MKKNAENTNRAKKTAINNFRPYLEAKDLKEDDALASKEINQSINQNFI